MIRPAKLADLKAIVELGIESLEVNDPYPELLICRKRITEMAKEMISSASHFAWVAEDSNGEVVGAVCAYSGDNLFYERKNLSVLMYYCREVSSGGFLLRKVVRWYKTRPILKMITFTMERNMDPKLGTFLTKLGLDRELPVYVRVK